MKNKRDFISYYLFLNYLELSWTVQILNCCIEWPQLASFTLTRWWQFSAVAVLWQYISWMCPHGSIIFTGWLHGGHGIFLFFILDSSILLFFYSSILLFFYSSILLFLQDKANATTPFDSELVSGYVSYLNFSHGNSRSSFHAWFLGPPMHQGSWTFCASLA
jgi:hypothetical protein